MSRIIAVGHKLFAYTFGSSVSSPTENAIIQTGGAGFILQVGSTDKIIQV